MKKKNTVRCPYCGAEAKLRSATVVYGDATLNKYNRNWRFNCPAIRIRATEMMDIKRMAILAGTGLCGFILLLKLIGAIRGKKKKK